MEIKKIIIQRNQKLRNKAIQRKLGLKEYNESIAKTKNILQKIRNGEDY